MYYDMILYHKAAAQERELLDVARREGDAEIEASVGARHI